MRFEQWAASGFDRLTSYAMRFAIRTIASEQKPAASGQ
jgi:hypothetical protein